MILLAIFLQHFVQSCSFPFHFKPTKSNSNNCPAIPHNIAANTDEDLKHGKFHWCLLGNWSSLSLRFAICPSVKCFQWEAWLLMATGRSNTVRQKKKLQSKLSHKVRYLFLINVSKNVFGYSSKLTCFYQKLVANTQKHYYEK